MKAYEGVRKHMKVYKSIYKLRAYECIGKHLKGMEAYGKCILSVHT